MTSEVNRQTVFQTTKVRTALRKDGSWIRNTADKRNTTQPWSKGTTPSAQVKQLTKAAEINSAAQTKEPAAKAPESKSPEIKAPDVKLPEVKPPVVGRSTPAISSGASASSPAPCSGGAQSLRLTCSFCNTPVEGNVKISLNIPPIICHAGCFKCAVCAKPLDDMMSPMFHLNGRIHCERCFDPAFYNQ